MTTNPDKLQIAANKTAVSQLILCERESRDMGFWARMKNCYCNDSLVNLSWFTGSGAEFADASRDMAARGMKATHRLGPVLVSLNGDRAVGTLSGIIDIPTIIQGVQMMLSAHCLMIYRAQKEEEEWKLYSFSAIYRRDELAPVVPGESVVIPQEAIRNFRSSYRYLSYSLHQGGFTVNNDLPGTDRPESVQAILQDVYPWAGLPVPD